jgi:hypothetical protein
MFLPSIVASSSTLMLICEVSSILERSLAPGLKDGSIKLWSSVRSIEPIFLGLGKIYRGVGLMGVMPPNAKDWSLCIDASRVCVLLISLVDFLAGEDISIFIYSAPDICELFFINLGLSREVLKFSCIKLTFSFSNSSTLLLNFSFSAPMVVNCSSVRWI